MVLLSHRMTHSAPPTGFAFLDHPRPLAFAHRGGALEAEENTMPAFENAARLGYRYIETDVQASRDGVVVIFHDDTLERLTGAPGRVAERDWSELAQLRTRDGAGLVRLDETLETFPDIRFNIEPKSDASVEPLAELIRRMDAVDRICVGSFDQRRTDRVRTALGPHLCWSPSFAGVAAVWLAGWGLPMPAPKAPALQVPTTYHGINVVTPRTIRAAHARGVQVHVWTVDEAAEMERLLDMGVDGLMTDRPTLLREVLERRGAWTGGPIATP